MPPWNANIRAFNKYAELLKSRFIMFHGLYMHLYVLFIRTEETLHKTGSCYFTSQFAQSVRLGLWQERLKGKRTVELLCLSFFCAVIVSSSGWLIQGSDRSKRRYERSVWLFVFPRNTLPCFCMYSGFWMERKAWPLVAVSTHPPAHLVVCSTFTLKSLLSPAELDASWACQSSVLMGHCRHCVWIGWQGMVATLIKQISSAHMHAPLWHLTLFIEHKFKV